ncbi:MAG TPA: DUF4845 domain-containing protein [Ideonella sp.]|uniref:DUF4845 domain-containing protein n=1 Tax=Ideonella sp. TaxID=1929293 RepID=UPI002E36F1CC|nr:DUF4845 domain-containing protein [Ideonella sp.]HEX5686761.1 DUF4845 domain-containing protein [Ideonella sp.]
MRLASSTPAARRQRGLSLFGMLFWAVVVGGGALLLLKVYPSVQKYLTTRGAVDRVMRADPRPSTVPAIRSAFNRQRDIEYTNDMIKGEDLVIEAAGDGFHVGFAYDDEVELVDPVFLLIKYRYTASAR